MAATSKLKDFVVKCIFPNGKNPSITDRVQCKKNLALKNQFFNFLKILKKKKKKKL